ncbi:SH3 domain-containing protein [Entamoeba marina]
MELVASLSYHPSGLSSLAFDKGDVISVKEINETGLWKGVIGDNVGYFYVSMATFPDPPLHFARVMNNDWRNHFECLSSNIGDIVIVWEEIGKWSYCSCGIDYGFLLTEDLDIITNLPKRQKQTGVRLTTNLGQQPTILPCKVTALYDYFAQSSKEITFHSGDEMICFSSDIRWLYVQHPKYGMGYIPTSYVRCEKQIFTADINAYGVVLFDCDGDTRYHLNIQAGDVVYVEKVKGSWAIVSVGKWKYIIPYLYIKIISNEKIDEDTAFLVYNFIGQEPNELTIRVNEFVVILLKEDNGWALVQHNDDIGYVPLSYLCNVRDGESYVLIHPIEEVNDSENSESSRSQEGLGDEIWLYDCKIDEHIIQVKRKEHKMIVNTARCSVMKFEKATKKQYIEGRNRIRNQMERIESVRDAKEAFVFQQRANQFQQKRQFEQKTFLRQTMKTKKKTTPLRDLSLSPDSFLIEIQKKQLLYESLINNNISNPVDNNSIVAKRKINESNPVPPPLLDDSFVANHLTQKKSLIHPTPSSNLPLLPSDKNYVKTKEEQINDLIKENDALRTQVAEVEVSQKKLLSLIAALQKQIREIRNGQSSDVCKELKESKQEIARLKKLAGEN